MGIPYLFRYLFDQYPNIVNHIIEKCNIPIDTYCFDLNSLIHPVCQRFFPKENESKFGKPKRLLHRKKEQKVNISNKMIYSEICKEIEKRIFIIKPKKRILIAIDSIAGLSKISQQRQRRFLSVKSKTEEEIKIFDTNCISPGTEFMDGLSRYLDYFIKGKMEKNSYWKTLEVIFSNDKVVGEGEHKILQFIRKFFNDLLNNKESICVDSPDADVLMLLLGTHYPYLYVFRDNMYKNIECKHFLVDIDKLKNTLIETINNESKIIEIKEKEDKELIVDFMFMGMFFGNDFVHTIRSLEMNKANMDDILRIYFEARQIYKGRIVNSNFTLNTKFLKVFLRLLLKNESELFKNKSKFGYIDPILQKHIDDRGNIDLEKYRTDYYKEKLYITSQIEINKFCNEYLKTLVFILRYYLKELPDYHYNFKYHYSPFFTDLYNYVYTINEFEINYKFINNKPICLYEQLLSILPPESKNLVPKQFHSIYETESEIIDFFPINFHIDLDGKKDDYLGVVCLPFVDIKRLKTVYSKIDLSTLTDFERKRGYFGKVMIYKNENNKVIRILQ